MSSEGMHARNHPYVSEALQNQIRDTRLLIAGCGIGSQVAECAVRTGFSRFILIDGDTVSLTNLNRQFFFHDQIDQNKALALRDNLLRINPELEVEALPVYLDGTLARTLVARCDLVLDTIDFLDLKAIIDLHDQAHRQRRPLVSAFAVGLGAAVANFPATGGDHALLRDMFKLPTHGYPGDLSYAKHFLDVFGAIAGALDPMVVAAMEKVFTEMRDGHPCPAPQVAIGAHLVASVCIDSALKLLSGEPTAHAPDLSVLNLGQAIMASRIPLAG